MSQHKLLLSQRTTAAQRLAAIALLLLGACAPKDAVPVDDQAAHVADVAAKGGVVDSCATCHVYHLKQVR